MPYIPADEREALDEAVRPPHNVGELNYAVTALVDEWLVRNGINYGNINSAVGALECAKLELYRRIAGPYEDFKRELNGDAYESTAYLPED